MARLGCVAIRLVEGPIVHIARNTAGHKVSSLLRLRVAAGRKKSGFPAPQAALPNDIACTCRHHVEPHVEDTRHDRFGIQWAERCPSIRILLELRNPDIGCSNESATRPLCGGKKQRRAFGRRTGGVAPLGTLATIIAASAPLAIASLSHRQAVSDITWIAVLNY